MHKAYCAHRIVLDACLGLLPNDVLCEFGAQCRRGVEMDRLPGFGVRLRRCVHTCGPRGVHSLGHPDGAKAQERW